MEERNHQKKSTGSKKVFLIFNIVLIEYYKSKFSDIQVTHMYRTILEIFPKPSHKIISI
jgi:hypothetical protein